MAARTLPGKFLVPDILRLRAKIGLVRSRTNRAISLLWGNASMRQTSDFHFRLLLLLSLRSTESTKNEPLRFLAKASTPLAKLLTNSKMDLWMTESVKVKRL